ncbi:MAG TPA: hypothetical protein VGX92_17480 [Pyrinomonadaceae bacterium]|jgi:hypothetical protein|nr:hypothetical protein [Pyrinomonadaceae bacterium]
MNRKAFMMPLFLAGSLLVNGQSQSTTKPQSKVDGITTISYCELIQNASQYPNQQQVRVKATWNYGFEWTYLYDRECMNLPKAWVEFVDEDSLCAASKRSLKKMNPRRFDNKADVVIVGQLHDCGGCGHMGNYQYKFIVTCLENYKKIRADVP